MFFQTIQIMSNLGFSVGSSSMFKKHEELATRQQKKLEQELCFQIKQEELKYRCNKTKEMVSLLQHTDVTDSHSYQKPVEETSFSGNTYFETNFCVKPQSSYTNSCVKPDLCPTTDTKGIVSTDWVLPALSIANEKGAIHLPKVTLYSGLENGCFSEYAASCTSRTIHYGENLLRRNEENINPSQLQPSFEIIGDNVDLMKSPSAMTKEKQRQSLHWFLLIGLQKRVLSELPDSVPKHDILTLPNATFLPDEDDNKLLEHHMAFHIMRVLTKYVDCLKEYSTSIPDHISHPHMKETSNMSKFYILDLLDKSENKSDEMISILEHVHENYIPHTDEQPECVIEKKVFGGDVLTNERAYSAQLAMMNGQSDFYRLDGVIHRPEGLHRMMNFLLVSKMFSR